jgi:hypothetical protein
MGIATWMGSEASFDDRSGMGLLYERLHQSSNTTTKDYQWRLSGSMESFSRSAQICRLLIRQLHRPMPTLRRSI